MILWEIKYEEDKINSLKNSTNESDKRELTIAIERLEFLKTYLDNSKKNE